MRDDHQPSNRKSGLALGRETRRLRAAYIGLATVTVALMVLGALVRAHGAGLACPDWPLCFGEFIPSFDLKIAFEWSHRVLAGSVSLVFLALAILTFRQPELRARVGRLVITAGLLLILQIILGALTVWQLLAWWSVTAHLLTANAFVVCLCLIAAQLSEPDAPAVSRVAISTRTSWLVSGTFGLLAVQIALGGLMSSTYAGLVCPDWPTCIDGVWFPGWEGARGIHLLHRVVAYALLAALLLCAIASQSGTALGRLLRLALALGFIQVLVGIANVLMRLPVEVTALHSAIAAVLVITMALATREAWRSQGEAPGK